MLATSAREPTRAAAPVRRVAAWGIAAIVLLAGLLGLLTPWTIADVAVRDEALDRLSRASGISATAEGPITLRLLPRPAVEFHNVRLRGLDGAITVDADAMTGRLDILALLGFRISVVAAAFTRPTAVLDVDRLQPVLQAMRDSRTPEGGLRRLRTGGIAFEDGIIRLVSRDSRYDTLVTDVSATFAWPGNHTGASLAGAATWRGVASTFTVDVDRPTRLIDGGETLASLRMKSPILEADAEGTLSGAGATRATGALAASTPDLPAFLRMIGLPASQIASLHRAKLSGTAAITDGTLALDRLALTLEDMLFEGALAVRRHEGRMGIAGTLASDHVDLDPFLAAFPPPTNRDGTWSEEPLDTASVAYDDIDLRISASTASAGPFRVQDGSLSLQSGKGRMELSLAEARAYDGLMKGRVVVTLDGASADVRAELTLSRLDLKSLLRDLPGRYKAAGTVTGHVLVQGLGATPAALIRTLDGRSQINIRDGEIGGRLLAAVLHARGAKSVLALSAARVAPFDAAAFGGVVTDGELTLGDSWIAWPSQRAAIAGRLSFERQRLDARATVRPEGDQAAPQSAMVYDLSGPWRALKLKSVDPIP